MSGACAVDQIVLAVVDDPAVRASLQFALEAEGFRVGVFSSAEQLLATDPFPPPVCLVLDHVEPRVNGLEIVAALRRRGIDRPAILMTADASQSLRQRAVVDGLTLVEKPLLGNALAEAVRMALARG